jgi:hypothetical protein
MLEPSAIPSFVAAGFRRALDELLIGGSSSGLVVLALTPALIVRWARRDAAATVSEVWD